MSFYTIWLGKYGNYCNGWKQDYYREVVESLKFSILACLRATMPRISEVQCSGKACGADFGYTILPAN